MRPSPPSRPRSRISPDTVADQIVARLALYASRTAPAQVKANKSAIGRSVDQPDRDIRFYLFHGPDEAQSRALGDAAARGARREPSS